MEIASKTSGRGSGVLRCGKVLYILSQWYVMTLLSHITNALILSHRPVLERSRSTEGRTLRPYNRSSAAAAIPILLPRLPRHLSGFPFGPRTTKSCTRGGTSFNATN